MPCTGGSCSHTSSAVKVRMGATSRTSASVICHSTVCAERRAMARGREGVHAVLEHVEIKGAQVHDGELVHGLVDAMELEGLVPAENLFGKFARAGQHVTVERQQLALGHSVAGRVEAVQIAEQKAEGVAQLSVELGAALHQVLAGRHVFAEIDRRDPQAHDFAAHAVGNIDGIDAVAERFRHGAALLIERPAGRGHVRVRRAAAQRHRREQRRVEPAAVLVAALEVEAPPCSVLVLLEERYRPSSGPGPIRRPPASSRRSRTRRRECRSLCGRPCRHNARTLRRPAAALRAAVVCQASAPSRSKRSTILRFRSASMMGWLQPSHMKTAMGTPQMRWRLMHQSGRVAIMLVMRSLPHAGSQTTLSISSMASCRNVVS